MDLDLTPVFKLLGKIIDKLPTKKLDKSQVHNIICDVLCITVFILSRSRIQGTWFVVETFFVLLLVFSCVLICFRTQKR